MLFETNRRYDPERRNTRVERKVIGLQIPEQPELMYPNENCLLYFGDAVRERTEAQDEMILRYETEQERGKTLRVFLTRFILNFCICAEGHRNTR